MMHINWKIAENQSPIIFSHKKEWQDISLRHWNVLAGELLEKEFATHDITLSLRGTFVSTRYTENGKRQKAVRKPGELCLIPAGQTVALNWEEQVECAMLQLEPAMLARVAAEAFEASHVELQPMAEDDPLVWQIGMALLAEAQAEQPNGQIYAESLTHTLALHLLRRYAVHSKNAVVINGGLTGRKLRLAQEFINENLADDVTLAEIAAVVALSPYHFARAFKRTTGLTPQQYLAQRRVVRAKQLLAKNELPLIEISAQVGFKNQSHFTTFFRRYTTLTPKNWRDTHLS